MTEWAGGERPKLPRISCFGHIITGSLGIVLVVFLARANQHGCVLARIANRMPKRIQRSVKGLSNFFHDRLIQSFGRGHASAIVPPFDHIRLVHPVDDGALTLPQRPGPESAPSPGSTPDWEQIASLRSACR